MTHTLEITKDDHFPFRITLDTSTRTIFYSGLGDNLNAFLSYYEKLERISNDEIDYFKENWEAIQEEGKKLLIKEML